MIPLKVLIAEDEPADADLLVHQLRKAGYELEYTCVDSEAGFLAGLRAGPDIIFSDYSMPQFTGMRALELLRESGLEIPLILVSGTVGEETAVEAMRYGATDYFLKDRTMRMASGVERALRESRLRRERHDLNTALHQSEARLRSIIETTPECFKVIAEDGRLLEMNRAGLDMLEVKSLTELQSRSLLDFILPEYHTAFLALIQRVLLGETGRLEFEIVGLGGTRRYVETHASPLRDADGTAHAVLAITRDLTERRHNELQIQQQLEELRRWRTATLGREDRVLALKREVNELLTAAGQSERYLSAFAPDQVAR
jgi:PAS domain S-box-containing protein